MQIPCRPSNCIALLQEYVSTTEIYTHLDSSSKEHTANIMNDILQAV